MSTSGYYRYPTIRDETIVFVSEDDLWSVDAGGGMARRLTSNLGAVTYPALSPDGEQLAFVSTEEGSPEIYIMPAGGGTATRLTYMSSSVRIIGWNAAGTHIIFTSNYGRQTPAEMVLFQLAVDARNGTVDELPYGPARSIAWGTNGQVVLGRNVGDPARWKRYRGGTAGQLWIDAAGTGEFSHFLPDLDGNITSPLWLETAAGARVFFASDHEGIGNLYSARPDGSDLRRHTDHEDYYVRNPSTDGRRIVYHAGADLFVYDVAEDTTQAVNVDYRSPRVQRNRKFVYAGQYLNNARLHPSGQALAATVRGKSFAFYNFDGPVLQQGDRDGTRYRLTDWLNDGRRMVMISDAPGEEVLEIHSGDPDEPMRRLDGLDIGRAVALKVSPMEDKVAIANHRHELLVVDLERETLTVVERSPYRHIGGFDWSPDGRWLAYGCSVTPQTTAIRLYQLPDEVVEEESEKAEGDGAADKPGQDAAKPAAQGMIHTVTKPVLHDVAPAFDPDGRYLYFLSYREFNPVYDSLQFDLGFPWGMRPYLVTLRADLPNPFVPHPDLDVGADDEEEDEEHEEDEEVEEAETGAEPDDVAGEEEEAGGDGSPDADGMLSVPACATDDNIQADANYFEGAKSAGDDKAENGKAAEEAPELRNKSPRLRIDLEQIERRVLAFPVPDGRYGRILGVKNKALFTEFPIYGQLDSDDDWDEEDDDDYGTLRAYSFKDFRSESLADGVGWFELSRNRKKLLYRSGNRLRVIDAGEKSPSGNGHPRKSGWIDLSRVKVSIDPQSEWEQMFREAWRLQRDQFWTEDMSEVDWGHVYERYFPLITRISTRSEFSDLMWEMQGELGTSHAYEFGGDYRSQPRYAQGYLGAPLAWDEDAGGYRIGEFVVGDPWDLRHSSPLADPGVDVRPGDVILAVNGQRVDRATGPLQLLVNQAGHEVLLTLAPRPANGEREAESSTRQITVRTISDEMPARYRAWVERNRQYVHEKGGGRVGYVHIPDMGPRGYAEFHRGYLAELAYDALVVDVRFNGGGHVSQLILEKLARRRIGYDLSRWGGAFPYPLESVAGPMVAVTNEYAGSDGDIFCHSFKLLKLGPLVGKRTWGGVVGISPRHPLVDGTITTQPEFSFWFEDVGWSVENYGTEPDIEVDVTPQDYVDGRDPQLDRAVDEVLRLVESTPILQPDLSTRPSRALPKLPPRAM